MSVLLSHQLNSFNLSLSTVCVGRPVAGVDRQTTMGIQVATTPHTAATLRGNSSWKAEDSQRNGKCGWCSGTFIISFAATRATSPSNGHAPSGNDSESDSPESAECSSHGGTRRGADLLAKVAAELAENEGHLQRSDEYVSDTRLLY